MLRRGERWQARIYLSGAKPQIMVPQPSTGLGRARGLTVLVFRSYAAAACQAASTCWVCSGVGCALEPAEMRAAIMVRRSWVSMSSKAGSVLVVYQGW